MECCSPDVGDCQKCHPEMWIKTDQHWTCWKPKKTKNQKKTDERLEESEFVSEKRIYISHW